MQAAVLRSIRQRDRDRASSRPTRIDASRASAHTSPTRARCPDRSGDRDLWRVAEPFVVPLADLATLPRRELDRRLPLRRRLVRHWPALGGRRVRDLLPQDHRAVGAARTRRHPSRVRRPRRLPLGRADRGRAEPDVLLAERLDGRPLDGDHGAPVRLVSPGQYGYISTKHLCRIELHTAAPRHPRFPPRPGAAPLLALIRAPGSGRRSVIATCRPGRCGPSTGC